MLKLRLKRVGRKRIPSYRIVIMENTFRRDGKIIEEIGYYSPITKKIYLDLNKLIKWLKFGIKPTKTMENLLKKLNLLKL